jgi:hypothetical protein
LVQGLQVGGETLRVLVRFLVVVVVELVVMQRVFTLTLLACHLLSL